MQRREEIRNLFEAGRALGNDINKLALGFAEELVGNFHNASIRFQSPQLFG